MAAVLKKINRMIVCIATAIVSLVQTAQAQNDPDPKRKDILKAKSDAEDAVIKKYCHLVADKPGGAARATYCWPGQDERSPIVGQHWVCNAHNKACCQNGCDGAYGAAVKQLDDEYDQKIREYDAQKQAAAEAAAKKAQEEQARKDREAQQRQQQEQQRQQQLAQQQAQLKLQQQQLEQKRQQAEQQQAMRQQIIQGQQDMQQKTNQTVQNSIQQGTDALTNYANFLANESAKKEQATQQQREQRRAAEAEQTEYERQQRQIADEQERIRKEQERLRQQSITKQILGSLAIPKKTSELPDNITKVYFITFERTYSTNKVKIGRYLLNRYSDGTWMMRSDMLKKINFSCYNNDYGESKLLGAYLNEKDLQSAFSYLLDFASHNNYGIAMSLSFTDAILSINEDKPAGTDKNFWNN
jgi:hypothetical protein